MMTYEMFDDNDDTEITAEKLAKIMMEIRKDNPPLFSILISLLSSAVEAKTNIEKIYNHIGVKNDARP